MLDRSNAGRWSQLGSPPTLLVHLVGSNPAGSFHAEGNKEDFPRSVDPRTSGPLLLFHGLWSPGETLAPAVVERGPKQIRYGLQGRVFNF